MGLGVAIFLIFLALKLSETGMVADWSWWWVASPLWIELALSVIGFILFMIFTRKWP